MATGSWLPTTGGAWNNNANWSAAFPNALTDAATIATDLTQDETITLGQAISVGNITFSDNGALGNTWIIAPGGAFTLTLGTSTITTTTNATISAAVAGTAAVTKAGTATLTLTGGSTNTGAWAVNAGTLAITTAAVSATTGIITVAANAALTSTVAISKPITVLATGSATLDAATSTLKVDGTGVVLGAGSFTTSGDVLVGSTSASNATLTIPAGRTITIPAGTGSGVNRTGLANSNAALYQTGAGSLLGSATINDSGSSSFYVGGNATNQCYGYYLASAGAFLQKNNFVIGCGVVEFNGTTFNATDFVGNWIVTTQGRPTDVAVLNYLSGSNTFAARNNGLCIGYTTTHASGSQQVLNIDGSSGGTPRLTVTNAAIGFYGRSATTTVLLNIAGGGYLSTPGTTIKDVTTNSRTNLMGGTLSTTGICAVPIYIFKSGNKIGGSGTISAAITAPTGYGVYEIPVTNNGSGYIGPPALRITTSGSGFGAAARAVWNSATQQIDSVIVTSPGTGYLAGDTVTVTPVGGGGTGFQTGTPVLYLNTQASAPVGYDGALEKIESGTLTLTGANTNTGTYTVSAGTLRIGSAAAGTLGLNNASNAVVASGAVLAFGRSDATTYSGVISGSGTIAVTGGGRATLTGVNTFTSASAAIALTTAGSVLRVTSGDSIGQGTSFGITVATGTALELDGTAGDITTLPAKALSLASYGVGSTGGGLRNIAGNNIYSGPITAPDNCGIGSDSGTLFITSSSSISGPQNFIFFGNGDIDISSPIVGAGVNVNKNSGAGVAILRGTSSRSGTTTASAGYLGYTTSITSSGNSSFGNASSAVVVAQGAGLRYYGSGSATFSRNIQFTGGTAGATYKLESNGIGTVTHSTAPTYGSANVAKTLQLGGTGTAANTISYSVTNNGSGFVTLAKADAGTWVLSNTSNAYSGGTVISDGTLQLSIATWAAGAKVTGTGAVTVNAGGRIQTLKGSGGSPQNGRHTYAALTFAANARIRIGG